MVNHKPIIFTHIFQGIGKTILQKHIETLHDILKVEY